MRAIRRTRAAACVLAIAPLECLLAACAVYHPAPLASRDVEEVLASPERAVLERAASQLSHPYIAPLLLDFSQPLTPDEIAVIAVVANPDLRALRAQQRVADAQVFAAGLLPDPQLSVGIDKVLAPSSPPYFTSFTSSLSFDLLGPLAARHTERGTAQAAARKVRLDVAWQEWLTAGEAQLLATRSHYQGESAQLARVASDVAEHSLQRSLAALAAGDLKRDEIEARRIAAAENFARALAAERDFATTRLDLNHLLGLQPLEPVELAAPPPIAVWQPPSPEQLFEEARAQRLDLQALAAGYDSQESAVHRAVLGQYPRLTLSVNRARDTSRVQTIGPAVTLDLPLWNRNRGKIAVAKADRAQLRAEYAARLHQTRADIAALTTSLQRDELARGALQAQLPKIEQIAGALEAAAQRGDVTLPVAETARAASIDKRLALITLEQTCAENRLALTLAVGRPMLNQVAAR